MGERKRLPISTDDASSVSRRDLLKLMAASAALAGGDGCARERAEKILPYTKQPRHVVPGIPRYYATSLTLDGFAMGVLVVSRNGRPTKIEGNPDHPASLGATRAQDQAAVLDVYDPDRARAIRTPGGPAGFEALITRFSGPRPDAGERLRFLLGPDASPLVAELVGRVRERHPRARFTFFSATRPGFVEQGARLALGAPAQPIYDYSAARVVLSLDDDFLDNGPFSVRYARQFASRRRVSAPTDPMNRLYVVETAMTSTGTMADHRLRRKPSEVALVAARVAAEIAASPPRPVPPALSAALARFRALPADPVVSALARDLVRNAGAAIVTVGDGQPPVVHALGQLVNAMLGNEATAWNIAPPLLGAGDAEQDLPALVAEIAAGAVDTLVILGNNPVYAAPADLELSRRLLQVDTTLYLGTHEDETAARAGWFVPAAHALESWGDAAAYDGTLSIVQPLIQPLDGGRTATEILAIFAGDDHPDARRLVEESWSRRRGAEFADFWPKALTAGVIPGTASARLPHDRALVPDAIARALDAIQPAPADAGIEARFAPDPALHDGRFANNAWLLELPRPVTKLSWDNAALVSAHTASRLGLANEDIVELELAGRRVRAPVFVAPGHADDALTLHLGWGRQGSLTLARGAGFDANRIRTSASPTFAGGLVVHKIPGARYPLARSQIELRNDPERPVAPFATLAQFRAHPEFTSEIRGPVASLLPAYDFQGHQWAMTIDNTICTGCSACVVACEAENNVLVVGKEEVARGRIMLWLRIDQYLDGPADSPTVVNEPMLCQHCETAPCEYVCPVNATVHSSDGLNEMVYNRCVGTRFCSNNCPYKVRRFNWFDYNKEHPQNRGRVQLQHNADVTVRQRGVMEKCTYCVQRIRQVEINARVFNRDIRPGEVVTACAEACPTGAIQFGSLAHRETEMARWRGEPRSFEVLHDLGTRPRTVYLARINNPNPEIG